MKTVRKAKKLPVPKIQVDVTEVRLRADVYHDRQKDQKVKKLTAITLWFGEKMIANVKFGGDYSPLQAVKEFRKNPARFGVGPLPADHLMVRFYLDRVVVAESCVTGYPADADFLSLAREGKITLRRLPGYDQAAVLGLLPTAGPNP